MTLGTHTIVGGSIGALVLGHPLLGFCFGFLSHFLLDAIPHFDYKLLSLQKGEDKLDIDMKFGKLFAFDLLRISADVLIGLAVIFIFFYNGEYMPGSVLAGAFGAVLPDVLQFVYFKIRTKPLQLLQRFHLFIHARKDLNHRPAYGLFCQFIVAVVFLGLSLFKTHL
jgi:hypothetical protein